jgi:hypothetical protein
MAEYLAEKVLICAERNVPLDLAKDQESISVPLMLPCPQNVYYKLRICSWQSVCRFMKT